MIREICLGGCEVLPGNSGEGHASSALSLAGLSKNRVHAEECQPVLGHLVSR